nr:hypothetical protein B0A51_05542 [Rachicladosporium sp. CCFEE 5018]
MFIWYEYRTHLLDDSRRVIENYLKAPSDTCVYVPNATTGIESVLRNLQTTPFQTRGVAFTLPVTHAAICKLFEQTIESVLEDGQRPILALYDTISTCPGVRLPFEALTKICKRYDILDCIDGVHGIGQLLIDLTSLDPDFFTSNAHKWLYVPRPCAVLYVPNRIQHLMRPTLPTSFRMEEPFAGNFAYVGTLNDAPYLCSGEAAVMGYMLDLARKGGATVAEKLGTEVMENEAGELGNCTFAVVRLPIDVGEFAAGYAPKLSAKICAWVQKTMTFDHETAVVVFFYNGKCWVQLSAQVYLTLEDFEIAGDLLVKACDQARGVQLLSLGYISRSMSHYDDDYEPRHRRRGDDRAPPPYPGGDQYQPNERRPRREDPRESRTNSRDNLPPPPHSAAANNNIPPPPLGSALKREGSRSRGPNLKPEFDVEPSFLNGRTPDLERKNGPEQRKFRDKRDGYESEEGDSLRRAKSSRKKQAYDEDDKMPSDPRDKRSTRDADRYDDPPPRDRDRDRDDRRRPAPRKDDYDDASTLPPRRRGTREGVEYGADPIKPVRRSNTERGPDRDRDRDRDREKDRERDRPREKDRDKDRRRKDDYSDDDSDYDKPRRHRSEDPPRRRRDDRYGDASDDDRAARRRREDIYDRDRDSRRKPEPRDRDRRRYSDDDRYDDDRRDDRRDRDKRRREPKEVKIGKYDVGPYMEKGQKYYATLAPIVTPLAFREGGDMATYTYEEVEHNRQTGRAPCKCCRLGTNVDWPIPKELSASELRDLAISFSNTIFSNWTQLNAIMKRFELVLQKRWAKKSTKQRIQVLLQAWPGMSQTHRPDFEPFRNMKRRGQPRSTTCNATAQLWPHINQEDLVKGNLLPLYLHSRGRKLPEIFIGRDINDAHLGRGWTADVAEPYAMVFEGQRSPRTYGRILGRIERLLWKNGNTLNPRLLGILGMEVQSELYRFLHACTRLILHDYSDSQILLAPHQPEPEPPRPDTSTGTWRTVTSYALEAPYGLPQRMDIPRMRLLVDSRFQAAEDHLFGLREDPGYFLEQLKDWRVHDAKRIDGDTCRPCIWKHIASDMINDAMLNCFNWERVSKCLGKMRSFDTQIHNADKLNCRLQQHDEDNWAFLQMMINRLLVRPVYHFEHGLPISPRMRHCYHQPHDDRTCKRHCSDPCSINSQIHGVKHIVDEMQYMFETDVEAASLVDGWLMERFSDLAVLVDLNYRVGDMLPWQIPTLYDAEDDFAYTDELVEKRFSDGCHSSKVLEGPIDTTFAYPFEKRSSKETVTQMRLAEKNLRTLWSDIDVYLGQYRLRLLWFVAQFSKRPFVDAPKTPIWKDSEAATPTPGPQRLNEPAAERSMPLTPISANRRSELPQTATKIKKKTRGTADPTTPPLTPPLAQDATTTIKPIALPRRVYKVISTLLPCAATVLSNRSELSWDDFVYAFNALGLVPEKLYGSVWIFKPLPKGEGLVDVDRSIQFHEPKEVRRGNKIGTFMVKRLGRRLKRAFGWEGEMFVQE